MSRPRKPELLISDYGNFQREAFTADDLAPLPESDRRELVRLHLHDAEDERKAYNAVHLAINSARMELKRQPVSQAEHKAALENQARRAAQLLEYINPRDHRGAGPTYFRWAITESLPERTAERLEQDPLFKNHKLLAELLGLIEERSSRLAEKIDPSAYRKSNPHHVLAECLSRAAKDGTLPMQYSTSRTSRLAGLFMWCCDFIGIESGDPTKYLEGK
jgi:hypothetical protein